MKFGTQDQAFFPRDILENLDLSKTVDLKNTKSTVSC